MRTDVLPRVTVSYHQSEQHTTQSRDRLVAGELRSGRLGTLFNKNNTFVEPTPDLPSTTNVCPLSWYIYVVHTAKQLLPNCATGCHRRGYPLKLIDIKLDKGKQRKQAVVLVVSSS